MKLNYCFLLIAFATLFTFNANAQITSGNTHFAKGETDINAGLGLVRTFYSSASTVMPPLSVSAEYGITDAISVGGFIGLASAREEWFGGNVNYNFFILGARGSYHFQIFDQMDTYAGLMLGYNNVSANFGDYYDGDIYDDTVAASAMALSAYVGARYNLKDQWCIYGELGYGISVLNIGVSMKLSK
ncbi:MAG: hypothetical protein AAGG68_19555 [Bacteroidota bacterium]